MLDAVIDASLLVDVLLENVAAQHVSDIALAAPHLIDAEVGHALRRHVRDGVLSASDAAKTLERRLPALEIERYEHRALLRRAWSLRDDVSFCDALYIALAEMLGAPLLTRDRKLARIKGTAATIELV